MYGSGTSGRIFLGHEVTELSEKANFGPTAARERSVGTALPGVTRPATQASRQASLVSGQRVRRGGSVDPRLLVAMAFQEIASNAAKIGNLNISPELLETLLQRTGQDGGEQGGHGRGKGRGGSQ